MFTWGAFLPFWCLSSSTSVYQVLCKNCSMCTCISDAFVGREKNMSSYFSTVLTPQPFYFKSRIYKLCLKTVLHTWLLVKWGLCSSLFFLIAYKTFIFVLKILQFHYNEVEFLFFNFCLICSAFLCFLTLRIIFQQFWEILSQYHIHYPFNYILFLFLTDIAMLVSVVLVQLLSCVQLFVTPWISVHQASLSITSSRSLLKLISIELVMPSSLLIFCHPLFSCPQSLPASGSFPLSQLFSWGGQSIGVSASASVLPMNTQDWSFRMDWLHLLEVQETLKSLLQHRQ